MRLLLALVLASASVCVHATQAPDALFANLRYRLIGPFRGGRALAVTGVPGEPERFFFGSVGGGVWRSDNAGRTWIPVLNSEPVASIGAIAVAPSDPKIIYVGSGEADMRGDIQQGNGMYRSNDEGKTWRRIGLEDSRQIGRIVVDPKDPNTVYVAALGHQYGPNEMRGVFKSTDGGENWRPVLHKNPDVGAIDLCLDPSDSNTIFACLWSTRRPPWSVYPPSNGPGGGLFKSTDRGEHWNQVKGHGFPASTGRIGISVSPANPQRVYAVVDTNDVKTGGVYRSDDGGENWTLVDGERRIWGRGWYFCEIKADPKNADEVYVMNTSTYRSMDGGKSFIPFKGAPGGDDYHGLWIDPNDSNRMILSSDQGVVVSVDHGDTWSSWYNQPTGQFYHVAADNRFPYWVYGAQQDSGSMAVPSRTIHTGISTMDWRPIDAGGESDMIAPDPFHPGALFGSNGVREELNTASNQSIDPALWDLDDTQRYEWTKPIAVSEADPHLLYMASQKIFLSADGGASWKIISPDLTRQSTPPLANLDATTAADDTGLSRKGVVYWIAPSPLKVAQVWAGTDDGQIWLTLNQGRSWDNVTPSFLGPWSKIGVIDASHFDAATAYVAVDRHRLDDNQPYIYRTRDMGKHWDLIVQGIPDGQFVNVVREDPQRKGLLYAGTDWGVFVSFDDGNHWQAMQENLPVASIRDIVFQGDDVIVGTHGRAIWVLDNPAPLRQHTDSMSSSRPWLYKPSKAVLFHRAGSGDGPMDEGTPLPPEEAQGENPQWGALIDYVVPGESQELTLTITDSKGNIVRNLSSNDRAPRPNLRQLDIPAHWIHPHRPPSRTPGGNRYAWDLRDSRGPLVPPGMYKVTMTFGSDTFSQPLEVVRDPRLPATDSDLRKQYEFALQIEDEMKAVSDARTKAGTAMQAAGLSDAKKARLQALIGGSGSSTPDMGTTEANNVGSLTWLSGRLGGLNRSVQSAPGAPTAPQRQLFETLKVKLDQIRKEIQEAG